MSDPWIPLFGVAVVLWLIEAVRGIFARSEAAQERLVLLRLIGGVPDETPTGAQYLQVGPATDFAAREVSEEEAEKLAQDALAMARLENLEKQRMARLAMESERGLTRLLREEGHADH